MAEMKRVATTQLMLALVCASLVAGCGRTVQPITAATAADGSAADSPSHPSAPYSEAYQEETPTAPEADPVAGPVNLPSIPRAATTPVAPADMQVRALALTNTIQPAPGLMNGLTTVIIRAKVSWTPVKGAVGYRVYQLAASDGAAADDKGKLAFTTPKWLPAAIIGGGMNLLNLKVGQEYDYTVEALDRAGNVIATGKDNCAPLAPLSVPFLTSPKQNESHVGQTPYLNWTESRGADGYYVEVFGTIRNTIPAIPMWRGFRSNPESMNMLYGSTVDVMDGTRPMQWSLPLNVGSRYAWTVSAVRTDTHNMQSAKAIAQATAPIGYFLP